MLVASLALVAALVAAVVVGAAALAQGRMRRALAELHRADLVRTTSYAEAERAAAWLTNVTDPITRPLARPIADARQSVRGSLTGALAWMLPSSLRLGRSRRDATLERPAAETKILAELGRSVDEAVLERRDLTADLSEDATVSLGLVDD